MQSSWQAEGDCWLRRGQRALITGRGKKEIMLISAVGVRHFRAMLQQQLRSVSCKAWRKLKAGCSNGAAGGCIYYTQCLFVCVCVQTKKDVLRFELIHERSERGERGTLKLKAKQKVGQRLSCDGMFLWCSAGFRINDERQKLEAKREKYTHILQRDTTIIHTLTPNLLLT